MNLIGIEKNLDWPRIRHLFKIGLFGAVLNLAADMLLGYGVEDASLAGMQKYLSAYVNLSDARLFWSAFLGLIGISLEGLCLFAVYRLMADKSPKHAHIYRAGIFGYLMFGACGFHVPCLMACFVYKNFYAVDAALAIDVCVKFAVYFMLPAFVLFFISFILLIAVQISAFAKGLTPYPRWCWVFSLAFFLVVGVIMAPFRDFPLANAIAAGWISVAHLWVFGGLLAMSKKAEEKTKK